MEENKPKIGRPKGARRKNLKFWIVFCVITKLIKSDNSLDYQNESIPVTYATKGIFPNQNKVIKHLISNEIKGLGTSSFDFKKVADSIKVGITSIKEVSEEQYNEFIR